jgi:hypothetical protein
MTRAAAGVLALALLAGCGGGGRVAADRPPPGWRDIATDADRERLRGWRDAWLDGLGRARAAGEGPAIVAAGALFEPDRALPGSLPPAGAYRCRLVKLGANGAATREFASFPTGDCRIDGDRLTMVRPDGGQRLAGRLFGDGDTRAIFLGTVMYADERAPPIYGRDAARDMAGMVQRVGERRWRLILPRPRFESIIDVVELVPASGG